MVFCFCFLFSLVDFIAKVSPNKTGIMGILGREASSTDNFVRPLCSQTKLCVVHTYLLWIGCIAFLKNNKILYIYNFPMTPHVRLLVV